MKNTLISLSFTSLLLSFSLLHYASSSPIPNSESEALGIPHSEREALEIIIGGGGGGPAPSPSDDSPPAADCPPPPPQLSRRLVNARRVLLNFATTIDDPNCFTSTWQPNVSPCQYKGVKCDTFPDDKLKAVSGLDFNQANFSGRGGTNLCLTGLLDSIPELTFFHVNSNNFSGQVPSQILKFKFFYELDLSNNKLQGSFPMEAISNRQILFLDLRFNTLTGSLPPELFKMLLDVIFVNNNRFSGYLPWNFGNTPARFLTFANNFFTGPIPKSIGSATNITEVLFLGNHLSGCLPYEIGLLKKLRVFDASRNSLTGPIPESFACLDKIQFLNLANNKFYGPVPESVCELPGICNNGNLTLAGNYFTNVGPKCKKLIDLKILDVSQNCIKGLPNQKSPQECYKFLSCAPKCPNEWSLKIVPCKKGCPKCRQTASVPQAPVTYEALKPTTRNRLM